MMKRSLLILLLASLLQACAFTSHKDKRPYPYATENSAGTKSKSIKILSSSNQDNIIGHIKNTYGLETADITIPNNRTDIIQKAIEIEFTNAGYQIDPNATTSLVVRSNQFETEIAQEGAFVVGYWTICDWNLYLKTKEGLFERNVVSNDKVTSNWYVTAADGVDVFYKNAQQCAKQTVQLVQEKVK